MATDFKLEQRAYIKIRTLLGLSPSDILADLHMVYKDISASYSNVKYWAKRFREGQEPLEDGFRSGRPKSVTTSGNILEVEWLVEEDPHIAVEEIAMRVGMSTGAAHAILADEMKASKICSRWIRHALTEAQKDNRVRCASNLLAQYELADPRRICEIITGDESWIRYDEPLSKERNKIWVLKGDGPPLIPRPDFRDQKVLYSIFFDAQGPVAQIIVPKGKTITGEFYANNCLSEVDKHYWQRRPKSGPRGLKLLHDNARPHKTKLVKSVLEGMKITELEHPPYSPDLVPCDFWLFSRLKKDLAGRHFKNRIDLGNAVWRSLKSIPPEDYKQVFFDWLSRLKRVIECKGNYIEKL